MNNLWCHRVFLEDYRKIMKFYKFFLSIKQTNALESNKAFNFMLRVTLGVKRVIHSKIKQKLEDERYLE